jgi:hypothetical protein
MNDGLRAHPTVQIVFQRTFPRWTPESDARVEMTQELIKYKSGTLMPWESKRIVLVRLHLKIVKQKNRSILRALLINRILEYLDSALEIGNVLYRYLIRIDWMEM